MDYETRLKDAQSMYALGQLRVNTTPTPKNQKFPIGSFVRIAADLGRTMSHFHKDIYAKVECTYAHAYGGENTESYSLYIEHKDYHWSISAWYKEHQLALVTNLLILQLLNESFKRSNHV